MGPAPSVDSCATKHKQFCCPSSPEALESILRSLRSQAAKQKEVVRENMILFSIVAGIISQGDWSNGRHPTAELQYVRSAEVIDLQYFPGFAAVHQILITCSNDRAVRADKHGYRFLRELLDLPRVVLWRQHPRRLAEAAAVPVDHFPTCGLKLVGNHPRANV